MRRASIILTALGCGALAAALSAVYTGCSSCDAYVECTAKPGLRYVACGKDFHSFNDGAVFESASQGDDYCYCSPLQCTDGGSVQVCNRAPTGGGAEVRYQNGSLGSLAEGIDVCLGIEGCAAVTTGCSFKSWYIRCDDDGGVRYLTAAGLSVGTELAARLSCVRTGTEAPTTSGVTGAAGEDSGADIEYCANAIEDCLELEDCAESTACYDAAEFFSCASTPSCSDHDDAFACDADPACNWEIF